MGGGGEAWHSTWAGGGEGRTGGKGCDGRRRSRLLGVDSGHFGRERVDALPEPVDDCLTLPRDALPSHELGLGIRLGLNLRPARLRGWPTQREKGAGQEAGGKKARVRKWRGAKYETAQVRGVGGSERASGQSGAIRTISYCHRTRGRGAQVCGCRRRRRPGDGRHRTGLFLFRGRLCLSLLDGPYLDTCRRGATNEGRGFLSIMLLQCTSASASLMVLILTPSPSSTAAMRKRFALLIAFMACFT